MKQQDLLALIDKYLDGKASEEETDLLHQYYNSFQQTKEWDEEELGEKGQTEIRILQRLTTAMREQETASVIPLFKRPWFRIAAAAIFIAGAATASWWLSTPAGTLPAQYAVIKKKRPVHIDKPTLTMTNGTVMILDSLADGVLFTNRNTRIRKRGEKVFVEVHPIPGPEMDLPAGFNTLDIPKGRQYEMILPDGSQVWLNAASSLRFPIDFHGGERKVEVSGEAYFEVAKDKDRPFRVYATTLAGNNRKGTVVEVLGTHFNVNAYEDEAFMKTTLLEGSVKVTAIADSGMHNVPASILAPGDQAQVSVTRQHNMAVKKVDVDEVVAWKNNVFNFNNADLQTIMRQIARWYNVEVVYQGRVPVRYFSGKIKRDIPLATVLEILEQSKIRFRVKGEQIIVRS